MAMEFEFGVGNSVGINTDEFPFTLTSNFINENA